MSKKIQLSFFLIIGFLLGFVLACFLLKASLFIVLFFRIKDNGLVNENIKMGYRYETYSLCPKCCLDGDDFYLSHQPADKSSETSLGVVDIALNIIPVPEAYEQEFHAFVRKSAHFFAYAFLAMLIYYAYRGKHRIFFTLMSSLLYAIS